MRQSKTSRSQRGSALVVVLFSVLALAAMSAAVISTGLFRYGAARKIHEAERAFQAATSGLDLALYEMQEGVDLTGDEIGAATGSVLGSDYTVSIAPAFTGAGEYTLTASGTHGPIGRGIEIVVSSEKKWGFGVFAKDGITIGGDFLVDSYDSSLGSYASQVFGDHAGEDGDIASNGDIHAGSTVWGDATPGPDSQVFGNLANVSGSTAPALFPITMRTPPYIPVGNSLGPYTGTAVFNPGIYRYDSLKMVDVDTMTITGDVTLFIDHDFKMTGESQIVVTPGSKLTIIHGDGKFEMGGQGILNQSASPSEVRIISSTTEDFKFAGGTDFYGMIYAPSAYFTAIGGSDIYGVVVCREAQFNGTGALHYDEALRIPEGLTPMFRVESAYRVAH